MLCSLPLVFILLVEKLQCWTQPKLPFWKFPLPYLRSYHLYSLKDSSILILRQNFGTYQVNFVTSFG